MAMIPIYYRGPTSPGPEQIDEAPTEHRAQVLVRNYAQAYNCPQQGAVWYGDREPRAEEETPCSP